LKPKKSINVKILATMQRPKGCLEASSQSSAIKNIPRNAIVKFVKPTI